MNTAERLKELRERRGLSQEQLAKIIGVDRTTIVKYETGASRPTRYLKKIAHYFDVTTDYLLGNEVLQTKKIILTQKEKEHLKRYRALIDDHKEAIDAQLDFFYKKDTDNAGFVEKESPKYGPEESDAG